MKKIFVIILIGVVFFQTSCNAQPQKKIDYSLIKPDSTVIKLFGDTICDIVFAPKKVNCYTVKSMEIPDSTSKMIGSYVQDKTVGKVDKSYYVILQFLLKDSINYKTDSAENKCKFSPYIAFEFIKKKEKAILFLAFNCKQWGIEYNGKLYTEDYNCENQLLNYVKAILPEDKYLKVLTKNQ